VLLKELGEEEKEINNTTFLEQALNLKALFSLSFQVTCGRCLLGLREQRSLLSACCSLQITIFGVNPFLIKLINLYS